MKKIFTAALFLAVHGLAYSQNPLIIPPALTGTNFTLTLARDTVQFYSNVNTPIFSVNGTYLGPTLIVNRGDSMHVDVVNNLGESTTMHWHGMHVPSVFDGGPHILIQNNSTWNVDCKIMQPASTNWYHPHKDMATLPQVTKGIAGMIIVKDTIEGQLTLPRTYGTDDFPIVLQDRTFLGSGNFNLTALGDSMLINGTPNPYLDVPAQVVRFRVLNGSNARTYNIGFSDNRNFYVIASDGGLIAQPYQTNRLMITNGERYEILLDLNGQQGDSVYMMSYGSSFSNQTPGGGGFQNGSSPLNASDFNLLKLRVVAQTGTPVTTIPSSLITLNPWNPSSVDRIRTKDIAGMGTIEMGMFTINGVEFDMWTINDTIRLDDIEIWRVINSSNFGHPMHLHDVSFYILSRNGSPPPAYDAGLKDVFLVLPGDTLEFITKFEDFWNDTIPYMFHCHNLQHEDMGMMSSFIVVNTLGVEESISGLEGFSIYPNPANGNVTISWYTAGITSRSAIRIYSSDGRLVKSLECDPYGNIYTKQIDVQELPAGLYLLNAESVERSSSVRFIKY